MKKYFSIITLGCAKTTVDTEFIIGIMADAGYAYTSNLEEAKVIIVNSCAFLSSSVSESLNAVFEAQDLRKNGKLKTLVLTGCLIHRYKDELYDKLPEVDIFLSTEEIKHLPKILNNNSKGAFYKNYDVFLGNEKLKRIVTDVPSQAYVKIAEGCNHRCAYCTIPLIKGKLKSRSISSIIKEVRSLVKNGVKEVSLIAQDLSEYGSDLKDDTNLNKLIDSLHNEKFPCKFRLLYLYPTGINDGLLSRIVKYDDFCNYIDLPLQHSSENILKAMYRPVGKFSSWNIIKKIHEKYPQISIRTTFIVGFPGETREDVEDLKNFVKQGYFSSVGIFAYSHEEGSLAYSKYKDYKQDKKQVKRDIKEIEIIQQKLRVAELKKLKGKQIKVLLEGFHKDTDLILVGRTEFQAPEVDGEVLITNVDLSKRDIKFGEFYNSVVTKVDGYNLEACLID